MDGLINVDHKMALQQFTKPAIKSVQVMLWGGNFNLIITDIIKVITCIKG